MIKKRYLALSTFIHLLPLIIFALLVIFSKKGANDGEGKQDEQSKSSKGRHEEVLPRPENQDLEVTLVEQTPEQEALVKKILEKPKKKAPDCKYYFGGIGIQHDESTGKIVGIYDGYAADRAGLKRGDLIISPAIYEIRGLVGTSFTLVYQRDGVTDTVTLTREKICIKKEER